MITQNETNKRRMILDQRLKGLINAAVWDHVKKSGLSGVNNPELSGLLAADALTRNYAPISDAKLKSLVMSSAKNSQLNGWWDLAASVGSSVISNASNAWDAVSGAANGAYDWIRSGIGDVVGNAISYGGDAWDTVSGWWGGGQQAPSSRGPSGNVVQLAPINVTADSLPPNNAGQSFSPIYEPAYSAPTTVNPYAVKDAVADAVTNADMSTVNAGLWSKGIDMASNLADDILRGYIGLEKIDAQRDIANAKSAAIQATAQGGQPYPVPVPVQTRGGGGGAVPSPRGQPIGRGPGPSPQSAGLPWPLILGGSLLAFFVLSDEDNKKAKGKKAA